METASTLATAAANVMADIVTGDPSTVEDENARDLFVVVANRLSLTRGGELLLDRFEERPHDSRVWNALRHAVQRQAESDDIFAATMRRAVRRLALHIGALAARCAPDDRRLGVASRVEAHHQARLTIVLATIAVATLLGATRLA